MDIFVVRLNPDPRNQQPYSGYPTVEEYNEIYENSTMDGFHEAVNFLSEAGVVKGYLPPRFSSKIKSSKEFILVTITAKGAKIGGDKIVGIQGGCKYVGEKRRTGGKKAIQKLGLTYHYTCPSSLSLLLNSPLSNARDTIIEKDNEWWRGPTYKLKKKSSIKKIIKSAIERKCVRKNNPNLQNILALIDKGGSAIETIYEGDSTFEDEVEKAFKGKTRNKKEVKGNKNPSQKEVRSYQYERDPEVAAYALKQAKGICQDCNNEGPFISKRTNFHFLEVHHIKQLKDGGEDTIDNVIAICPNCHRKRHYG